MNAVVVFFVFFFLTSYSVFATPLLAKAHLVFLRDVWIRTQRGADAADAEPPFDAFLMVVSLGKRCIYT